jgi:hypothetical protein
MMMYRNHREYKHDAQNPNHELLRSWLRGETGIESLKEWLSSMYS